MNENQRKEWASNYERQLDIAIRSEIGAIRRFYIGQYDKAIADFLATNKTVNFLDVFKYGDFLDIYVSLYRRVGLRFANWSFKELEGRQTKAVSMDDRQDVWEQTFIAVGNKIGRSKIVIVQGTALRTLEIELTRLMRDPEFMGLGNEQRARILRKRFNLISQYQAERIARTETAIAANQATKQSANDFYGGPNNYDKIWNHGGTRDPRPHHIALDGVRISGTERFNVGGELMDEACSPFASAGNVINCGCSTTYVDKEPKDSIDVAFAAALATLVISGDEE